MRMFVTVAAVATLLSPAALYARHTAYRGHGPDYYTNVSGHRIHRPVRTSSKPIGATARCGDGSWSFSEHHQGTCSHHGGVTSWM